LTGNSLPKAAMKGANNAPVPSMPGSSTSLIIGHLRPWLFLVLAIARGEFERNNQDWFEDSRGAILVGHDHNSLVHGHELRVLDRYPTTVGKAQVKRPEGLFLERVSY
jgi:hypothetical protein